MVEAITTAVTTVKTDAVSVLLIVVPVAIGLGGLVFVVKKAMSWFKSLGK
jgi:hypothetical protein